MFGWFRRKEEPQLAFPDNEAAFAHACTIGYRLLLNALIPAPVADEGRRGAEGEYFPNQSPDTYSASRDAVY